MLRMLVHCFLSYLFWWDVSLLEISFTYVFLCVWWSFCPLAAFSIFSLSLVLSNLIIKCHSVISFCLFCLGFVELLETIDSYFHQVWKNVDHNFFIYSFYILLFFFWDSIYIYVRPFDIIHWSLSLCSFFFLIFCSLHLFW